MEENNEERDNERADEEPPPTSALGAVTRRFMRYLGEEGSGLTGIWLIIAFFNLGMLAIATAIQYKTGFIPFDFDAMRDPAAMRSLARQSRDMNVLGLLNYPLALISSALYYSGMGAMRRLEEPGESAVSFSDLRGEMFEEFSSVLIATLLFMLAVGFGTLCCLLPGLIAAFLFMPAPYIASKRRFGATAGFRESLQWLKRHTMLYVVAALVSLLVTGGILVLQYVATTVFVERFGQTGMLMANATVWIVGVVIGYFTWIYLGSLFTTIDLAEERFRR